MQLIQAARANVRSFLEQCNVPYKVVPFDEGLYQECIDEATRRGYPVDGDVSLRAALRVGVIYAATACGHLPHRPSQIWIALCTAYGSIVDDMAERFPEEMPNIYLFNDRFIRGEPQGSSVLDAAADLGRRASEFYRPIASHLITTSLVNGITATLLEHEMKSMKVSSAAQLYPNYHRIMTSAGEGYGFMAFPREIPVHEYIQAIPDIALFIYNLNDVLSFYKEEQVGDTVNQISMLAASTGKLKLEILDELTETTINIQNRIVKILEGSPEACEAFKHYAAGYVYFHISTARYRLEDLDLQALY